jgi:hypothetical protein
LWKKWEIFEPGKGAARQSLTAMLKKGYPIRVDGIFDQTRHQDKKEADGLNKPRWP